MTRSMLRVLAPIVKRDTPCLFSSWNCSRWSGTTRNLCPSQSGSSACDGTSSEPQRFVAVVKAVCGASEAKRSEAKGDGQRLRLAWFGL